MKEEQAAADEAGNEPASIEALPHFGSNHGKEPEQGDREPQTVEGNNDSARRNRLDGDAARTPKGDGERHGSDRTVR